MFILRFDFVFFLLSWHSIRVNAMLCSCFVRQFSPWHNPNKLALPFSSAPRQFSNKFDIALGLSSVWFLLIWLTENFLPCVSRCLTAGIVSFLFRKSKTSDFFGQKYGCFALKVRRFYAKKSDVSLLPEPSYTRRFGIPQKKFCKNILHFLHPIWKIPIKSGNFRCRVGCRISSTV